MVIIQASTDTIILCFLQSSCGASSIAVLFLVYLIVALSYSCWWRDLQAGRGEGRGRGRSPSVADPPGPPPAGGGADKKKCF